MALSQQRLENAIVFVAAVGVMLVIAWLITGKIHFALAGLFLGVSLIVLSRIYWRTIHRKTL